MHDLVSSLEFIDVKTMLLTISVISFSITGLLYVLFRWWLVK